ncbi:MAG: hypothetical protein LBU34_12890 [Planctomycetaceae bacterium]|jgi:hypothetical protein|nr:hypothetical protein [Planctomycetaceae bacterium]
MYITGVEVQRNLRSGISQPDIKTIGRQPLAVAVASALADSVFILCWLFGLPIGKRPWVKTLRRTVAYLLISVRTINYPL